MPLQPIPIDSKPGIRRDGTALDGDVYTDGEWVRFQRGRPRKIGGYRRLSDQLSAISRGLHAQSRNNVNFVHSGHAGGLDRLTLDNSGVASLVSDRTPAGFASSLNNLWQFDVVFNPASNQATLFAHAAPNALDISSSIEAPVYFGDVYGTAPLTAIGAPLTNGVSGGIVALQPFLFAFGNDGVINWSSRANPTVFSPQTGSPPAPTGAGTARVASQKIVRGMPMRGGGGGPSGLFWSLDSVVRASFSGGETVFSFDTISSQSSILSAQSVIEYDGIFYWCGVDRFLMFNGVVREVPNQLNLNWFFDNLNFVQRQKVFAFKVPRFGEIWWCYPRGNAVECSHAVILNVRENTWYDTPLPDGGRSAAQYAQVFNSPLMAGVVPVSNRLKLFQHEFGVDAVDGSVTAIRSFFDTAIISLPTSAGQNKALSIECIEPDFVQSGSMNAYVLGRANPRAPNVESAPKQFAQIASTPQEQVVMVREIRRQLRLRFESNVVGGDYQMGRVIAHVEPASGTILG